MTKENPAKYVINSDLLDIDSRRFHIFNLLDLYLRGEDFSNSDIAKWGRRTLKRKAWFYGCELVKEKDQEKCIQMRQKEIIAIYESIKKNGYTGTTISIYFDKKTGQVHTYDGYHRLSILKHLGLSADCNCVVSYHHPTRADMRGDFPLAATLLELNKGKYLYEPIDDLRVKNWTVWRPDSEKRLDVFKKHLVPGTVLDVGCSSGFFSRKLAQAGFVVTSLEINRTRLAVARYLSIIKNLKIRHIFDKWQNLEEHFDNILLLSVLHHDFLGSGVDKTFENLRKLSQLCKVLVVEVPLSSASISWLKKGIVNNWSFTLTGLSGLLELWTHKKIKSVEFVHAARPIFTLINKEKK